MKLPYSPVRGRSSVVEREKKTRLLHYLLATHFIRKQALLRMATRKHSTIMNKCYTDRVHPQKRRDRQRALDHRGGGSDFWGKDNKRLQGSGPRESERLEWPGHSSLQIVATPKPLKQTLPQLGPSFPPWYCEMPIGAMPWMRPALVSWTKEPLSDCRDCLSDPTPIFLTPVVLTLCRVGERDSRFFLSLLLHKHAGCRP